MFVMNLPAHAIGQAVFIRTDVMDYAEDAVPFRTLEEMIQICTTPRADRMLEKVLVFAMDGELPVSLTLGFIAASKGRRPGLPQGLLERLDE